jgi:hypothetical protein
MVVSAHDLRKDTFYTPLIFKTNNIGWFTKRRKLKLFFSNLKFSVLTYFYCFYFKLINISGLGNKYCADYKFECENRNTILLIKLIMEGIV